MPSRVPVGATAVQLLALSGKSDLLHVTTSERRADQLARALSGLAPEIEVVVFPPWDCLPYDRASPSREAMGRRMAALRRLGEKSERRRIVVTTPDAALQRVPPQEAWKSPLRLVPGEAVSGEWLMPELARRGYVEDDRVDEVGEVANRGEVADIYPAGLSAPYRLEAPDGRIDAIRAYDPLTQRTLSEVDELLIDPASELVGHDLLREPGAEHWLAEAYPKLDTLLDILPKAKVLEAPQLKGRRAIFLSQVEEAYTERKRSDSALNGSAHPRPVPSPERLYLTAEEWERLTARRSLGGASASAAEAVPQFASDAAPARALGRYVVHQLETGRRVVLASAVEGDLRTLVRHAGRAAGRAPVPVKDWASVREAPEDALLSLRAELEEGFVDPATGTVVITARDLLGSRAKTPDSEAQVIAPWQIETEPLHLGDIVVHADHGVGVLRGLETVETPAGPSETLRVEYAKGAGLMVPVGEAARLWRYGSEEGAVALDHLNTDGWVKRRAKIQAEIEVTAQALIALAAERNGTEAARLVPPAAAYERFAARFRSRRLPTRLTP
jgi:transcription-repair coupling factor (superfamily II helicase)